MAVVSFKLAVAAIIDLPTIILTVVSLLTVFRFKINSAWLVLGGAIVGFFVSYL
jgi:chromate transporter